MKKIGLFVGIDNYDDKEISKLHCAARDARELASVFKHKLNYETFVLTHDELKKGQNVNSTLLQIGEKFVDGGVFIFYFAGHGNTINEADEGRDQLFLLPNVLAKSLSKGIAIGEGVVSYSGLRAQTDSWDRVQSAYILDVCRLPLRQAEANSRDGAKLGLFHGEAVYRDTKFGPKRTADGKDSYVLLNACHNKQRAEELGGYQGGHGLFTASLLETLKNYHDLRRPVVIDEMLTEILFTRMKEMAREFDGRETEQKPLKIGTDLQLFSQQEEECAHLVASFELQLAARKLDRPVGDNCLHTLHLLLAKGYDRHHQQILNTKLQAMLDARELLEKRQRDQQRFDAASKLNTGLAYCNYLATCELCEHKVQAEKAIEKEQQEKAQALKRQAEMEEKIMTIAKAIDTGRNPLSRFDSMAGVTLDAANQILAPKPKTPK
jgi:hypothetical protein